MGQRAVALQQASATYTANGVVPGSALNGPGTPVLVFDVLLVTINLTAFSGAANITFFVETQDANGVWCNVTPTSPTNVLTTTGQLVLTLCGQNSQSPEFGFNVRVRWVFGTPAGPSATFSVSILGK